MRTETPQEAAKRLAAPMIAKGYKPAGLHIYETAHSAPIYWRIRLKHPATGDKWIRPMHANDKGYVIGEPKHPPEGKPLYALERIAGNPGAVVWIVEGEQKADAINKLGFVATTSGSATSAEGADWSPVKGRECVIWPDKDTAGQNYADDVTRNLGQLGCRVDRIDVSQLKLGEGEDVIDWLALNPGATKDDIGRLPRADDWSAPLPLSAKVAPEPYPLDALPDTIRAAVIEVQQFTQAPISMVATSALAALSLAIQAHADVKRAEKLTGPTSLYSLIIADSGERKTTCDGFFTQAIRDFEAEQADAAKPAIKDFEAENAAWQARQAGTKEKIKALAKDRKPTTELEKTLRDLEDKKPKAPRVPVMLRGDDTPENLAWVLSHKWPSGGVLSSEAGIVLGAHGMGKDSIMRNLGLLNILWDGGTLSIGRRTSESFTVRGARLTVALQVQEATLRNFLDQSRGLARGMGFLARFLIDWPESTQGSRPYKDPPESWPALTALNRRIAAMLEHTAPIDDEGALTPSMYSLAPAAKAAWVEFHDGIESELKAGGELFDVRDVASKSADNVARLATLLHIFEHGMGGDVELASVASACRIVAWHLNESRRFFGELALPKELAGAARLDDWLIGFCRRERTHVVPVSTIQKSGPGGIREKLKIEMAMRELAELDRARTGRGGKRKWIEVNPALLKEASE